MIKGRMILILFLSACQFGDYSKSLPSGYELSAIDEAAAMSIYYSDEGFGIGIVNASVFAIGYDEDFIIAKQHPREFPDFPNKSITNYFIIPLTNKINQSPVKNRIGPLTEIEFQQKRKDLKMPNTLTFTIVFEELE